MLHFDPEEVKTQTSGVSGSLDIIRRQGQPYDDLPILQALANWMLPHDVSSTRCFDPAVNFAKVSRYESLDRFRGNPKMLRVHQSELSSTVSIKKQGASIDDNFR